MTTLLIFFVLFFSLVVLYICRDKNAWDILFFNTTLATITLFAIGLIAQSEKVWLAIVGVIGIVATGEKITSILTTKKGNSKHQERE